MGGHLLGYPTIAAKFSCMLRIGDDSCCINNSACSMCQKGSEHERKGCGVQREAISKSLASDWSVAAKPGNELRQLQKAPNQVQNGEQNVKKGAHQRNLPQAEVMRM